MALTETDYRSRLDKLREFSDLQGECARKAQIFRMQDRPELAARFDRASLAAVNARMLIHAALMAEREARP